MPQFQLRRTNHDSLEFEGELLSNTNSPRHETEHGQRGYELALYKQLDGGFAVSIEYETTCPNEKSVVQAEVVDEPKDVENVLLILDACEHVDNRTLTEEQRKKLRKALYRIYDDAVTQQLAALTKHCGNWQAEKASASDQSEPAQKRGFLSFSGLSSLERHLVQPFVGDIELPRRFRSCIYEKPTTVLSSSFCYRDDEAALSDG